MMALALFVINLQVQHLSTNLGQTKALNSGLTSLFHLFWFGFAVLGIKPRAIPGLLGMLGKCCTLKKSSALTSPFDRVAPGAHSPGLDCLATAGPLLQP